MNRKYHNEFKGIDGALNRIDILSKNEQIDQLVKTTGTPFLLQYQDTNKLTPIQGAQATIELVSETNFQFKDLHTDDMQDIWSPYIGIIRSFGTVGLIQSCTTRPYLLFIHTL